MRGWLPPGGIKHPLLGNAGRGQRYQRAGKTLHLRHLSPDCRRLLGQAGALVEVNILEDPTYRVAGAEVAY